MNRPPEALRRFYSNITPTPSKEAERERIAQQMAEWEAEHGPVETLPINPVPVQAKMTKKQVQNAMRNMTLSKAERDRRQNNAK